MLMKFLLIFDKLTNVFGQVRFFKFQQIRCGSGQKIQPAQDSALITSFAAQTAFAVSKNVTDQPSRCGR